MASSVPQLPKTNMLDLGIWMSLQSMVEKAHQKKVMQHDKLSKTVMDCFDEIPKQMLDNVVEWWKQVLYLICIRKGWNELVEQYSGKKGLDMDTDLPDLLEMEVEVEVEDNMKKFAELTEVDLYSDYDNENDMVLDEALDSNDEDK